MDYNHCRIYYYSIIRAAIIWKKNAGRMLDRKDERGNSNENKKQVAGLTDPFQFLSFIVCILFFPLVLLKTWKGVFQRYPNASKQKNPRK